MEQKKNAKSTEMETLKMSIESVPPPSSLRRSIAIRPMVLMGSGPTNVSQRVHDVLNKPHMGIYQHEIYQIMDEVKEGLKYLFQTRNKVTFCTTGSGNAGMDTVLSNLIEVGDVVLIGVIGTSGLRAADMARRYGADVRILEPSHLGESLSYEQIRAHVEIHKPKILFIVHGDSSTGVLQSLENLGDLCRRHDCLLVVDTVATLGAVELLVDEWKIDAAFAASQKTLGAPPGLAPITIGQRAVDKIAKRKTPPPVYYYDARLLADFWKCTDAERVPHHTIWVPILYALREAIAEIIEQTLEIFRDRHTDNSKRLQEGLQNIGLELFVKNPADRLPSITSVRIPQGVSIKKLQKYLIDRYSLEIAQGFGLTEPIIFRIGTMNSNASHQKVDLVLRALYDGLKSTSNYIAPVSKIYY